MDVEGRGVTDSRSADMSVGCTTQRPVRSLGIKGFIEGKYGCQIAQVRGLEREDRYKREAEKWTLRLFIDRRTRYVR